jgi:hypothetical protein
MNPKYNGFVIRGSGDLRTIEEHIQHADTSIKGYRAVQLGGKDRLTGHALTVKQIHDLEDRIIRAETHRAEMAKAVELYNAERDAPYQGPSRAIDTAGKPGIRTGHAEIAYDKAMEGEDRTVAALYHAGNGNRVTDRTHCRACGGTIAPGSGHHTAEYSFDTFQCMKGFCE